MCFLVLTMKKAVSISWGRGWRNLTQHFGSLRQKQLEFEVAISILKIILVTTNSLKHDLYTFSIWAWRSLGSVLVKRSDSSSLLKTLPSSVSACEWMALMAPVLVRWPFTAREKFILIGDEQLYNVWIILQYLCSII